MFLLCGVTRGSSFSFTQALSSKSACSAGNPRSASSGTSRSSSESSGLLENGDPPPEIREPEVRTMLERARLLLEYESSILLHCSAGIHRTGMIGNALLRHVGLSQEQARQTLLALRAVTAEGVGEARLRWGDRFGERSS